MLEPQFTNKTFKKRFLQKSRSCRGIPILQQTHVSKFGVGVIFFKLNHPKIITGRFSDTVRRTIIKQSKRRLHFWYYHYLTQMVTQKPKEIRMGKGKGAFSYWSEKINISRFLFFFSFFQNSYVSYTLNNF